MFLLDTNVISELRRVRPHGAVLGWLETVDDPSLHLSAVTLGEIQRGIEKTREQDPAKAAPNHSNRVVYDEDCMSTGIALHAAIALRHLALTPPTP